MTIVERTMFFTVYPCYVNSKLLSSNPGLAKPRRAELCSVLGLRFAGSLATSSTTAFQPTGRARDSAQ